MITHSLLQGQETEQRIEALLQLTSISSPDIRNALFKHYVEGWPPETCCWTFDVPSQNLRRAFKKLNRVYSLSCAVHNIT